jgi:hypothetical protein
LLGSGKSPGSTASEVGRLSIKGATRKWHQIAPPTGSAAVKGERLLLLASVVKTVKEKPKLRVKDVYERTGGHESDGYRTT